jgi:hypothetical protein
MKRLLLYHLLLIACFVNYFVNLFHVWIYIFICQNRMSGTPKF